MPGRIERAPHDRDYTVIANDALRDERLSWKARGLLAYLLTKPDDWTVMQAELEAAGPDGRSAVRAGLAELERHGYLERERTVARVDGQTVTTLETSLWETPGGGNRRSAHRGAETGLYEVPIQKLRGGRKPPLGEYVQPPLVAVVVDVPEEPGEMPEWMRERDRLAAARAQHPSTGEA